MEPSQLFSKTRNSIPKETLDPSKFSFTLAGSKDSLLLVLIHGLKSAQQTFFPIFEHLSKNFQVLIYDQRGHGQSPIASYDYSLDSMAEDLKKLLTYLDLDKKELVLLGHSAGGRTSMRYCELYPEKIKALIIEDMEFIPRKNKGLLAAKNQAENFKKLPEEFTSLKDFNEIMGKIFKQREIDEISQRRVFKDPNGRIKLLFKPWVAILYGYFYENSDFTELCKKIDKPTIIIQAEPKESAISAKGAKSIINCKNKYVELTGIPGSGHNVHGTKTIEFLKILEIFLKKI